MATVLTVLKDRYTAEVRVERGDWSYKINLIRSQLDQVLDRVQVRWGPFGNQREPSTIFNCKILPVTRPVRRPVPDVPAPSIRPSPSELAHMAAFQFYNNLPSVSLAATTATTVIGVSTPTNQRVKVLGYGFYFDGTLNSAQPVQLLIGAFTSGAAFTSVAAVEVEPELTETDPVEAVPVENRPDRGHLHGVQDLHRPSPARLRVHGPARSGGHRQGRARSGAFKPTPRPRSTSAATPSSRSEPVPVSVKLTVGHLEAAGAALCGAGRYGLATDFFRRQFRRRQRTRPSGRVCTARSRLSKSYSEAESAILEAIALERTAQRLMRPGVHAAGPGP